MSTTDDIPAVPDDGLPAPEVGQWSLEKYRLVKIYAAIFARSMKHKWQHRIYIDLFAGAGRSTIRDTGVIVESSPMIALRIPDPFTHHIFCEQDDTRIAALETRVRRDFPSAPATFIHGDVNACHGAILDALATARGQSTALAFCFADPFSFANLHFDTIRSLSHAYMDFLILIPVGMEGQRFIDVYHQKDPGSAPLDTFMGTDTWRTAYAAKRPAQSVDIMLTEFYADRMRELHYRYGGVDTSAAPPFLNGVHSWPTPPPSNGPNPPGTRSPAARR
ncbi:MAG: three-Cys-motif partner protein TcmP [bacterium]|nr:three-Cys-motif partner protein TcmP [bacterium]